MKSNETRCDCEPSQFPQITDVGLDLSSKFVAQLQTAQQLQEQQAIDIPCSYVESECRVGVFDSQRFQSAMVSFILHRIHLVVSTPTYMYTTVAMT